MSTTAEQVSSPSTFNPNLKPADIELTPSAQQKMTELFKEVEDEMMAIRIFVSGGGCGGMQYGMTFSDQKSELDSVLDNGDYRIFVDAVALNYMRGVQIDYVERPMGEATFVFNNVFAATGGSGSCGGCGSAGGGCGS